MKAATKKLILTKSGSVNKLYSNVIKNSRLDSTTRRVYCVRYTGSGRFAKVSDNSNYVREILHAQGYKFTEGNDAPRGGQSGNYIEVSRTAFRFLISLV